MSRASWIRPDGDRGPPAFSVAARWSRAASKTLAAASGRYYVTPDDVKALGEPVLAPPPPVLTQAEFEGVTSSSVVAQILIETAHDRSDPPW